MDQVHGFKSCLGSNSFRVYDDKVKECTVKSVPKYCMSMVFCFENIADFGVDSSTVTVHEYASS